MTGSESVSRDEKFIADKDIGYVFLKLNFNFGVYELFVIKTLASLKNCFVCVPAIIFESLS